MRRRSPGTTLESGASLQTQASHAQREVVRKLCVRNTRPLATIRINCATALRLSVPVSSHFLVVNFSSPQITKTTSMLHMRQDALAQLANPKLTPERRAKLRMELCAKSSQFRATTALLAAIVAGRVARL